MAQLSVNIGWSVLLTAGLSFVGAGVVAPTPEWGSMIATGFQNVVTGQWSDGRVATVRGIRAGKADYGAVAFTEKGVQPVPIGTKYIYRELCKQIVVFFTTKKPPVDPAVTVEIMAFIEAANKSATNHGAGEKVAV